MVANSQKGLQAMMDRLDRTSREYGMKINIKKTKILKISKGKETMVRINIGVKEIEQVKEFCYLGSVITTDAKCHREIRRRIAIGKEAFSKRRELLRGKVNRTLKIRMIKTMKTMTLKIRMIKTMIDNGECVVLYGEETWTMWKEDIKRLEAFEMWTSRRMEKVTWTEHKTNEEILETIGEERSLIRTIKTRQKKWIGHTLRGESLLKTVIEGKILGKRSRGRPRQMMLDWMMVEGYRKLKEQA